MRKKSAEVPVSEIKSPKVRKIIADMKKALFSQSDGVAIAAPQIGVNERIFVISGRVEAILADKTYDDKVHQDRVFINPKISKLSREKKMMEEGCLSVRWLYGMVKRSQKAAITAFDENAKKIKIGGAGLLAQIFQHEVDHLEGILFTDKAEDLQEIPPEKNK